jgi:pseudaminic acid cytidylyltransferase
MKRMPQDALAIVPARGGSKRIPRKNIRPFLGKPILARVVETLLASGCFAEVMVSTEDAEIAAVARSSGAAVPFLRSPVNSNDTATTAAVLLEVLGNYAQQGKRFPNFCCVYPTAVFVTADVLKKAKETLDASGADTVIPVLRFSFPIQRAFKVQAGELKMFQPEHMSTRSQDLDPAYHDAGQFYWARTASFLEQQTLYARKCVPVVLDDMQAHDIDSEQDWRIAEFKYSYLHERERGAA